MGRKKKRINFSMGPVKKGASGKKETMWNMNGRTTIQFPGGKGGGVITVSAKIALKDQLPVGVLKGGKTGSR